MTHPFPIRLSAILRSQNFFSISICMLSVYFQRTQQRTRIIEHKESTKRRLKMTPIEISRAIQVDAWGPSFVTRITMSQSCNRIFSDLEKDSWEARHRRREREKPNNESSRTEMISRHDRCRRHKRGHYRSAIRTVMQVEDHPSH